MGPVLSCCEKLTVTPPRSALPGVAIKTAPGVSSRPLWLRLAMLFSLLFAAGVAALILIARPELAIPSLLAIVAILGICWCRRHAPPADDDPLPWHLCTRHGGWWGPEGSGCPTCAQIALRGVRRG